MQANRVDVHRLSLLLLRLMDTDLLLPKEGNALLAEIAAFDRSQAAAALTRAAAACERLLPTLEALMRNNCLNPSIGEKAQKILRRILYGAGDPA